MHANNPTRLADTLGTAFAVVKSDMQGNITKLQTRHDQAPAKSATLQDLVNAEKAEKKSTATEGLLWLKRGLQFTAFGLRRNIDNPIEELSVSFGKAYELTLSKHHNFMIRGVFSPLTPVHMQLAMNACPSRAEFYKKLAGEDPAKMKEQLSAWLSALEKQVQNGHFCKWQRSNEHEYQCRA
eukprot:jgi/Hompol1/6136/HPOL_000505-RA